ncbi:2-isopropylmalate synthase [Methanopyrus sp. KOL6]|uniref:2-isopropylmalate synthase n=1 Tax=Methanopyrus sp. KOL6 TaxID=1937004 RepID=UPI000B4B1D6E|nr:2-isopropylmalate synthase [Methanopyrus sp. KOL6]
MPDRVRIFDTTLRDGEQTPGVSLTVEEKVEIAMKLDEFGVDTIEAGFPVASEGEFEAVKMIASEELEAEICGLARCVKGDIDAAIDADVDCVHVFIATSDIHLKYKLEMSREEALERAVEGVEYASDHGVTVEFSAEDATRTDWDYLLEVYKATVEAGADRVNVPDTVGVMTPPEMYRLTAEVVDAVNVPVSVHCHNDFGMAVANSLAAVEAGAEQVHVTVNGIGERAGNASLEQVVMALKALYDIELGVRTEMLVELSRLVERLTGVVVPPNTPIVGENAFAHESGIHSHGVIKKAETYEPIRPEDVGHKRRIVLGKHAGRHAIKKKLEEMRIEVTEEQLDEIVRRVKELGDKGKRVTEDDLEAIARDVVGEVPESEAAVKLEEIAVMTGNKFTPTASVRVYLDGEEHEAASTGVGPVDAAIRALRKAIEELGIDVELKEYRLEAITGGTDALAEVTVRLEDENGNVATARGAAEDIVMASVKAFVRGVNRLACRRGD